MRHLRRQLIDLLELARQQHRMDVVPPRLMAVLVRDFLTLLPMGRRKRIEICWRTLSHGSLHRHIFTIRCPDQAFYLDAIKGYLLRQGIQPIGQQTLVARMSCDPDGCDLELRTPDIHDEDNFMFIALHISATMSPDIDALRRDILAILQAVDLSVGDFLEMQKFIALHVARMMPEKPDAAALLDWMNDGHYLYFGILQNDTRLGLLRNRQVVHRIAPGLFEEIAATEKPREPGIRWLNLAACQRHIYSAASVEAVDICWTGPDGQLDSAFLLGHFSRSASFANASYLPMLASHWRILGADVLLQHSAFYRREIRTLFDRMPKRILMASKPADWLIPLKAIIDLADPLQVVAEPIPSITGNVDTLLVAISANRFGPVVLQGMNDALEDAGIRVYGHESFGIGPHRIILISIEQRPEPADKAELYSLIRNCIVFWKDLAKAEVLRHAARFDLPSTLKELASIPPLYQELFPPAQFTRDIQMRKRVLANGRTAVHVSQAGEGNVVLHIYSRQQPSLGTLVDVIRAFGLDPVQEAVVPFGPGAHHQSADGEQCIHISSLTCLSPRPLSGEECSRLRRALAQVLNDEADNDPLNALVVIAGLSIEEATIMIALRNHLIQLLADAAKLPLTEMMLRLSQVSARLLQLFAARHVAGMPGSAIEEARTAFDLAMADVASLTDDRWFRALAELVEASLRTNAFIRETGSPVAIKIASRKLGFISHPKPWREIFVHGVHLEGVHLRAGPVARGGLRYSDRPADFRTEVLELMATQVVKNGQIVPTGSKGGFVIRGGTGPSFVLAQYRMFIRTMLALTDNLSDGQTMPPEGMMVAPEDANDPYFVVAADKGTARFSDDANAESEAAGFWLGDAFASGGRHGYDHKAVGITARGAWVCAAHHFAKLGIDAYSDPISCVAIGDMGGDVFGNGMLLNPALKLIAAFNHMHIFLDPEPDADTAFAERKRLFEAASGWDGYDAKLISSGGGVFARSAKRIPLSAKARAALGIEESELSGEALIRAILTAPVELLYNGGIGTYVKAAGESHAEVRDPANNSVRVNGGDLRCRVVSEGGNLGFTSRGRIEYALAGGIINTDAMDNSAGVDMSDHEVNLKILLSLKSERVSSRNRLLASLTEDVTRLCLDDNLLQSRCLTLAEYDAGHHPARLYRLRNGLINQGWLDLSTAPDIDNDKLLHLRPQLSVLLGQEKNRIHERLSEAAFERFSTFAEQLLEGYFPGRLRKRFGDDYRHHPLAADIIQTMAANHIVNHFGLCAVHHLETLINATTAEIVEALLTTEQLLEADLLREAIWQQVGHAEHAIGMQYTLQQQLMLFTENLLRLQDIRQIDQAWVDQQRSGLRTFRRKLSPEPADIEPLLEPEQQQHLQLMPQLAQSACAVHLSSTHALPLERCLEANRICLELLPFEQFERALRSSEWGDDDAHKLRREWLHRLTLMQSRAISLLLEKPKTQFRTHGEALWHSHHYWPDVAQFMRQGQGEEATPEVRRMRLLLALTRMESIVHRD